MMPGEPTYLNECKLMTQVVIVGCGIVGAEIAYELSRIPGLKITLLDQQTPASGSTGAALGVLMGVISQKTKGRAWRSREISIQRYDTLIPELESLTGISISFNRQGILRLCLAGEDLDKWEKLVDIRRSQGWNLERWNLSQIQKRCPQIHNNSIIGAIYSPQDRQVNPTILTQALVAGAAKNGVDCQFEVKIQNITSNYLNGSSMRHCQQIYTTNGVLEVDWLIISAGLGSTPLTSSLEQPIDIRPVLGQTLHLKLKHPLGNPDFQPVITGNDVHIVPVSDGEYWVGATVEFPDDTGAVIPQSALLDKIRADAINFCPLLAKASIVRTWSGKRPRPEGQPAPIIDKLTGYDNVLLATGHYRNGILLAPATAQAIGEFLTFL